MNDQIIYMFLHLTFIKSEIKSESEQYMLHVSLSTAGAV